MDTNHLFEIRAREQWDDPQFIAILIDLLDKIPLTDEACTWLDKYLTKEERATYDLPPEDLDEDIEAEMAEQATLKANGGYLPEVV